MNDMAAMQLGREIGELFSVSVAQALLARMQQVLRDDQGGVFEVQSAIRGTPHWYRVSIQPMHDAVGQLEQLQSVGVDITECRQTEELIATQRDLARIIATAPTTEDAWPHCLELALHITGMDSGGIYLFDAAKQVLELVYHQGLSDAFIQVTSRYPIDTPNAQLVLAGEPSYLSTDAIAQRGLDRFEALTCGAVMPIHYHGQVLGCVNLASHTLLEVPAFARQALETIAAEIGNMVIHLRTESALRAEQLRLTKVAATIPGAINTFLLNPAGTLSIPYASRAFEDLYGLTLADVAETIDRLVARIPAEQTTQLMALVSESAQTLQPWRHEYQYHHPSKGTIWLEGYSMPVREPDGSTVWHGITTDITERKQAEQLLHESQLRVELAIKGANLGTWDWYLQTGHTVFNERWAEIVGYTLAELSPVSIQTWVDLCHPDDLQRSEQQLQQHFAGKTECYECEVRMHHKNGDWIWVLDHGMVVEWDITGVPVRMAGTHRDITAHKQAEIALRLSEEHYRGLAESLDSLIVTIDAAGMFLYVNQVAARLFGGAPHDFVGKKINDIFPAEEASTHMDVVGTAIREDRVIVIENQSRIRHEPRWYRTSIQPIHDEGGQVIYTLVNATDIHDLKLAQQQLIELNQTLEARVAERTAEVQDLYNHAPVGYHSLDSAGKLVRINQTEQDWLGYTSEELIGHPITELFTPPSRAAFPANFALLKERGWVRDIEIELIRKDGSIFSGLINTTAIYDKTGAFVMTRSTLVDISQRRQVEAALRESEARFRRLADNAPDVIYRFDYLPVRRFTYVSTAITAITGYLPDDYYANAELGWHQLHVDDRLRFQQYLTNPDNLWSPIEMRWIHRSGTVVWVEQRNVPIFDGAGCLVAIEGIVRDISESKRVSEALRASEARLHLLLSRTPAVIFSALAEGDFHTTFISESIRNVLGYESTQFMSNPRFWESCIHPDDKTPVFSDVAQLIQHGWRQYEYRCCHADGNYRWVENGVSLLPARVGHPAEVVGYLIDITERKQAEEILRQANLDMAHAARMKDAFLANMSHELRSPLNAILGFSESLQEAIYGPLTERQQVALRHIETSGRHLLALITDILDLSKIEAGRMTLVHEQIEIAEICQASLLLVKELAIKKALRLAFQLSDQSALIEADPKRLKQILVNLLSNAVKFTPNGGQVSLEVTLDGAKGMVCFAVRDTGIGIAAKELARLFQPFVQLESSLSRQHEGTGLGLALVRRLAEMHGGSVMVKSELGRGSCFTLVLPQYPSARVAEQRPPPVPIEQGVGAMQLNLDASSTLVPDSASTCILLAEDNEHNILTTRDYLHAKGFAVIVARTGPEVLVAAVEHPPDLILMDIQLPEIDGLELMRRLRAMPLFATTPIIALTALAMAGDRERCLAAGASAYLAKPVSLKELVEQIRCLIHP